MPSVGRANRLADAHLRHAVEVARYGRGRALAAQRAIDEDLFPDLLARLRADLERMRRRGPGTAPWETVRYGRMVERMQDLIADATQGLRREMTEQLRELARVEARWMHGAAERSGVELQLPDLRSITSVTGEPMSGRTMDEWWHSLGNDLQRRVQQEVAQGLAQGESDQSIIARVRRQWDRTQSQAEAIARTGTRHVAAQVRQRVAEHNPDAVSAFVWVATLEPNTCAICWGRHGRQWAVDRGPRPPAHPNCQCELLPVLRGEAAPEIVDAEEFFATQDPEWQDDALGPRRAAMLRAGTLGVRDLTTLRGRPLRLEELERRIEAG